MQKSNFEGLQMYIRNFFFSVSTLDSFVSNSAEMRTKTAYACSVLQIQLTRILEFFCLVKTEIYCAFIQQNISKS